MKLILLEVCVELQEMINKIMHTYTIIYLVNINFGESEYNAYWETFSLANGVKLSVDSQTNTHNTCDYNEC